jgi:hypothetical protein
VPENPEITPDGWPAVGASKNKRFPRKMGSMKFLLFLETFTQIPMTKYPQAEFTALA